MAGEVAGHFGRIDIVVNSASIFLVGPLVALPPSDVARMWAVNVQGTGRFLPDGEAEADRPLPIQTPQRPTA